MSHQAPTENHQQSSKAGSTGPVDTHRVFMLGAPGVGKAALISQFSTSECINAYEGPGEFLYIPVYISFCRAEKVSFKLMLVT